MKFVCPKPLVWHRVHQRLVRHWERSGQVEPEPPIPLILGGWNFSSDFQKHQRWLELIEWAKSVGVERLIPALSETDGYYVTEFSADDGVPDYLLFDRQPKNKPTAEEYKAAFAKLRARWDYVAGPDLTGATAPFVFAGKKRRNLVVTVVAGLEAPWGTWTDLSHEEAKRRTFTEFRKRVNEVIAPHKVDHVTFRERGA